MSYILLVEDDRWWAQNCKRTLERQGYEVKIAGSADDALPLVDAAVPQVIVLDFMLPGANAMQFLHELQSYRDTQAVPVVLCTSLGEAREYALALENYGVRLILDKATVTPGQFVKAVGAVIV